MNDASELAKALELAESMLGWMNGYGTTGHPEAKARAKEYAQRIASLRLDQRAASEDPWLPAGEVPTEPGWYFVADASGSRPFYADEEDLRRAREHGWPWRWSRRPLDAPPAPRGSE